MYLFISFFGPNHFPNFLFSVFSPHCVTPPPSSRDSAPLPQNAVNLYKKLSERVMPQPLVMHFTVCMLHLVEQLHAARLVHADVKPDNFLLGER